MKTYLKQKGSIALISVLVIAAALLILVLGMSDINISTSYQYLNNNSNKISYYAAEACLEEAMIRLEENMDFTSETINFDEDTVCTINASQTEIFIDIEHLDYVQHYKSDIEINKNGEAINILLLKWNKI